MDDLCQCPYCGLDKIFVGVHDDEGNYHGRVGCEYEKSPWSGLSYALHHDGWGECIMCTDGVYGVMGGVLFDTPEEAILSVSGLPAADVAPVRHGKIIETIKDGKMNRVFSCCGHDFTELTCWYMPKYCPNCGAPIADEAVEMVLKRMEEIYK